MTNLKIDAKICNLLQFAQMDNHNESLFHRREDMPGPLDSDIFSAIGEPTRLLIVRLLINAREELNITEIAIKLKRGDLPTISRHIKTLSSNKIVNVRKVGVTKLISLNLDYIGPVIESLYGELVQVFNQRTS